MASGTKRKRSEVWDFFKVKVNDNNSAVCVFCKSSISRGGAKGGGLSTQSYTTSNMMKHLKTFHQGDIERSKEDAIDNDLQDQEEAEEPVLGLGLHEPTVIGLGLAVDDSNPTFTTPRARPQPTPTRPKVLAPIFSRPSLGLPKDLTQTGVTSPTSTTACAASSMSGKSRQPTVLQVFEKTRPLKSTDVRALKITNLIAEMICTDNQPMSIVEDAGFTRLIQFLEPRYKMPSRKYFSTTVIPNIYDRVMSKIQSLSTKAAHISITTDMWSSSANIDYMSLTAHFLTEDMEQVHICLDVVPFPYESHNSENLAKFMKESLEHWGFLEKLNVIVRDNARNIVAAMELGKFTHIPCVAHTLQLVVKDGCLDNAAISSITATCRRIVGHFKHSSNSYKLLRKSQETLGLPKHSIIQDEPTRWNSTFHMLQRLIEQKDAILLVTPHFPNTGRQTKQLTTEEWESLVPLVAALKVFEDVTKTASTASVTASEIIPIINAVNISIEQIDDYGNFKDALKESMARRYGDCENEPVYAFATILDPRFKTRIFKSKRRADNAVKGLIEELRIHEMEESLEEPRPRAGGNNNTMQRPLQRDSEPGSVGLLYSRLLQNHTQFHDEPRTVADEVKDYLADSLLQVTGDPFAYWRHSKYKNLKKLARKYLGTPPSTVFSERLFSTAGLICDRKRSRLTPEKVKMLVFLNKNLPMVNHQY